MGWEFKEYEEIEHTGDVGIRVEAATRAELYRRAGLAFFDLLGEWGDAEFDEERTVQLEEQVEADLFVGWLSELNFLHQTGGLVIFEIEVEFPAERRLRASVRGRRIDREKDTVTLEVKAVTYHLCRVETGEKPLWARVIFDV